jgi:hypothetical protein
MKKAIILLFLLYGCRKDYTACEVGDTCLVRANVFNKGAFQPHHPMKADSVNKAYTKLNGQTYLDMDEIWQQGDSLVHVEWYFPQRDLFKID